MEMKCPKCGGTMKGFAQGLRCTKCELHMPIRLVPKGQDMQPQPSQPPAQSKGGEFLSEGRTPPPVEFLSQLFGVPVSELQGRVFTHTFVVGVPATTSPASPPPPSALTRNDKMRIIRESIERAKTTLASIREELEMRLAGCYTLAQENYYRKEYEKPIAKLEGELAELAAECYRLENIVDEAPEAALARDAIAQSLLNW